MVDLNANSGRPLPLVISMGEPAGIGPEIILKTWQARKQYNLQPFYVIGDPDYFRHVADELKIDAPIQVIEPEFLPNTIHEMFANSLPITPVDGHVSCTLGKIHHDDASLVSGSIIAAVDHVFAGKASGLVTAPINKKALYDSGFEYPGHTEFLAALSEKQTGKPATPIMMLAGPELRTIPVTIHIALSKVPETLTTQMILDAGKIAAQDLQAKFGIASPRIAVSGLNPHAGESGTMGLEDEAVVLPAVEALRALGLNVQGPLPADTMFHPAARSRYDVALCMYHDQALIPAKTLGFDDSVNVTLGLPFIRTSPDHGTALDIAGKGIANPASMIAAVKMAGEMVLASNKETVQA